jgi:alkylation response protein AidB-like acyl-CoA dehydrogenase
MITLLPNAEQQQIVDSVVDLLRSRCSVERLRDTKVAPGATEMKEWPLFAEMGWFGIALPEAAGGIGYSVLEEVLLFRELGREVVSPSVLASVLGAHLAWAAGDASLTDAIVAGSEKIALALPAGSTGHSLSADGISGDFYVVDRMDATHAIVWTTDGVALMPLDDVARLSATDSIDTSLALERVSVNAARPALFVADDDHALRHRAWLLITANLVGMAEALRDFAVEYAKVREQFGKPIGTFQAIAHHCANMHARADAAWTQTRFAALAYDGRRDDASLQVSASYLLAAEAASINGAISVRVHGAMGFTAETSVHHYVKRSVLMKNAGGGSYLHSDMLLAQAAAA